MEDIEGFLMQDMPDLSSPTAALDLGGSHCSTLDKWWWWDFQSFENIDCFDFTPSQEDNESVMHNPHQGCNTASSEQNENLKEQPFNQQEQQWIQESRVQEQLLEEAEEGDTVNDAEEEVESDDRKSSGSSSKNLISERKRRKRLNQQLFTLRSLVPNITKMDKRSILVDALAYLQGILQQTEAEMKMLNCESDFIGEGSDPVIEDEPPPLLQPQECFRTAIPTITQVDAEMMDEERFNLKITCNRAIGGLGQVQKLIQSLGLEITLVSVSELDQDYSLTMAFLRIEPDDLLSFFHLLSFEPDQHVFNVSGWMALDIAVAALLLLWVYKQETMVGSSSLDSDVDHKAKKKGVVTVEKLKHRVKVMAKKMSFHLRDCKGTMAIG